MPGFNQMQRENIARMMGLLGNANFEDLERKVLGTPEEPHFEVKAEWVNDDLVFRFRPMTKGVKLTKEIVGLLARKMVDVSESVAENMFALGELTLDCNNEEPQTESVIANLEKRIASLGAIIKGENHGLPICNIVSEMLLPQSVIDGLIEAVDNLEKTLNNKENADRIRKRMQSFVAKKVNRIRTDIQDVSQSQLPQGHKEKNNWNRTRSNPKLR